MTAPRPEPALLAALRADLDDAGYTVDALQALLGPVAHAALAREQPLPARRAVARAMVGTPGHPGLGANGPAAAVLLAQFVLGVQQCRAALDAALPRTRIAGLIRLGLAEAAGEGAGDPVQALVDLRPYAAVDALGTADWWITSDPGEWATGGPLSPEHVLGVGGASVTLARCAVRTPAARVLDLGTGCGVQALHAARHAAAVTGTDLSARALDFAAFNWALNQPQVAGTPLDLRQGSLLEPVRGEQYDRIVSNPPFVITPRVEGVPEYVYRDGGLVGDALVQRLITGMAGALAPGGVAQLLANWEHRAGEGWQDRVAGWLAGSGLDGWVIQREVQDPAEYAETWIRDGGQGPGSDFDALYAAWLDDFEARGVEAVGFGLVVLRRPAADRPAVHRLEELRGPLDRPLGGHLADCLAAQEWLARCDDGELAASRLVVAPDVTEERHHHPGEAEPSVVLLRQGGGFGRVVPASAALAGLVGACDGELTVGQLLAAVAQLVEQPVVDLSGQLLPALRGLVADGFLTRP